MLQRYTMAIVPCGNPTPKKLPTGGGEWPTFRTARAQRVHSARYAPLDTGRCLAIKRQWSSPSGINPANSQAANHTLTQQTHASMLQTSMEPQARTKSEGDPRLGGHGLRKGEGGGDLYEGKVTWDGPQCTTKAPPI